MHFFEEGARKQTRRASGAVKKERERAETEKDRTQSLSGANVQDTERRAEQQVYIKNALRSLAVRDLEI